MDTLSSASVDGLLTKIKNLASRPIVEFNKYEAVDLPGTLKNTARDVRHEKEGYFRLAYETLRGKLDQPNHHEKILGIVAKVEKTTDINSYQCHCHMRRDQVPNTLCPLL